MLDLSRVDDLRRTVRLRRLSLTGVAVRVPVNGLARLASRDVDLDADSSYVEPSQH